MRRPRSALLSPVVLLLFWIGVSSADSGPRPPDPAPAARHPNRAYREASTLDRAVRLFQLTVSRVDGDRSVHWPTTSEYARRALARHGLLKGGLMTADRLIRSGSLPDRDRPLIRRGERVYVWDPVPCSGAAEIHPAGSLLPRPSETRRLISW